MVLQLSAKHLCLILFSLHQIFHGFRNYHNKIFNISSTDYELDHIFPMATEIITTILSINS